MIMVDTTESQLTHKKPRLGRHRLIDGFFALFSPETHPGLPAINSYLGNQLTETQIQGLVHAYTQVFSGWNDPAYQSDTQSPMASKRRHLTEQGTFTDGSMITLMEQKNEVYGFTITKIDPIPRQQAFKGLETNIASIYPNLEILDTIKGPISSEQRESDVILYNDLGVRKAELRERIGEGKLSKLAYVRYSLDFMNRHLQSLSNIGIDTSVPLIFWTIKKSRMYSIATTRPAHFTALAVLQPSNNKVSDISPEIFIFETNLGNLQQVTASPVDYLRTRSRDLPTQPIQKFYYELK